MRTKKQLGNKPAKVSFPRKRESMDPRFRGDDRRNGTVFLIGAGPGDAGLFTLRGAELLREADVVVYDWLVNPRLLELAPQAEKLYVGKNIKEKKSGRYIPQDQINPLLVKLARRGKNVARLKGGDPFIFGRGGEEASYLSKSGIPFEIVPGVSAGNAVPAYAGIPITDRRFASSVIFVTGHEQNDGRGAVSAPGTGRGGKPSSTSNVDWTQLAKIKGTIVSFMGIKNLPFIVKELQQGGMPWKTPVSIIEWGTLPKQRVCEGNLKTIVSESQKMKMESPALTVIGGVNRLRRELAWFERRPLFGKSVLVTRARTQASGLKSVLERLGADVLEIPAIEIFPPENFKPLDRALQNLNSFDWIIFTSVNGVTAVRDRLRYLKKDSRALSGSKIAAIGDATQEALMEMGITPDFVPASFSSESLGKELEEKGRIQGRHFLLPRTDIAPKELREFLESKGGRVTEVVAYRTVQAMPEEWFNGKKKELEKLITSGKIDFITLTSSSTVKNFFGLLSKPTRKKIKSRFVSIGPVTSRTLKQFGYKPAKEASKHTIAGLIESLTKTKGVRPKRA